MPRAAELLDRLPQVRLGAWPVAGAGLQFGAARCAEADEWRVAVIAVERLDDAEPLPEPSGLAHRLGRPRELTTRSPSVLRRSKSSAVPVAMASSNDAIPSSMAPHTILAHPTRAAQRPRSRCRHIDRDIEGVLSERASVASGRRRGRRARAKTSASADEGHPPGGDLIHIASTAEGLGPGPPPPGSGFMPEAVAVLDRQPDGGAHGQAADGFSSACWATVMPRAFVRNRTAVAPTALEVSRSGRRCPARAAWHRERGARSS